MDSATLERIVQWEEESKKNKKPIASPRHLPVRAKKDIALRDVKEASTVDKRQYLETQKDSRSPSKSKSEETIEPLTTDKPSEAQSRKSYYEAWDKFDVDQALSEANDAPSRAPIKAKPAVKDTPALKSTPQKLSKMTYIASETAPNPTAANAEKEKGNDFFKKGQFSAAVEHYSASITLDPTNAVLPINRAMALLKLERFSEAENDCTLGLKLDSKNVKALWRRGIARRSLGRMEEARKDFEQALALDPNNKAVKDELFKLQSKPSPLKAPVTKTEVNRPATLTTSPEHVSPKKPTRKEDMVILSKSPKESSSPAPVTSSKRVLIKEIESAEGSELFPPVTKIPVTPTSPPRASSPLASAPLALAAESLTVQPTPLLASPSSEPSASTPGPMANMSAPSTTLDFQRDWKSYSRNPQLLYQYFKLIAPESLPGLFKSAFESDYLSSMLQVFREFYTKYDEPQALYLMLFNLAKVQRFDMTLMFMSGTDKKDLIAIFQHLNAQLTNQTYSEKDLASLASKFKTNHLK